MNAFQLQDLKLAAMELRLQKLEVAFAALVTGDVDAKAAADVAHTLGYDVSVLILPARRAERQRLAAALSQADWSDERIARVLKCSGKTVSRWNQRGR